MLLDMEFDLFLVIFWKMLYLLKMYFSLRNVNIRVFLKLIVYLFGDFRCILSLFILFWNVFIKVRLKVFFFVINIDIIWFDF